MIETSDRLHNQKRITPRERPKQNFKLETRNPKFETNSNVQKAESSKRSVLDFGFAGFGLFGISIFGFRILVGGG